MSRAYNSIGELIPYANTEGGLVKNYDIDGGQLNYKPYVREGRKIGRNEPCPCGSGLKFKKCHIGYENE